LASGLKPLTISGGEVVAVGALKHQTKGRGRGKTVEAGDEPRGLKEELERATNKGASKRHDR